MNSSVSLIPAVLVFDPEGPAAVLSNFYEHVIELGGEKWLSVEHYFQAQKAVSLEDRKRIACAPSAPAAKALAWQLPSHCVRPDWDTIRDDVMRRVLLAKFLRGGLAANFLQNCLPLPIYEDSLQDSYWGIGRDGDGQNRAGVLLNEARRTLTDFDVQIPPLLKRPVHSRLSRLAFIEVTSIQFPHLMSQQEASKLRTSQLTTVSIPSLMRAALRSMQIPSEYRQTLEAQVSEERYAAPRRAADIMTDLFSKLKSLAFDQKYADYHWADDARALFPDWVAKFDQMLTAHFRGPEAWAPALVIGAGSGEEASHIWRAYGAAVMLSDIGPKQCRNSARQAPAARVLQMTAENLCDLRDASVGLYVALRVFESLYLDVGAAIEEAWRVVRPGGGVLISISNGYQSEGGEFVRGRIVAGEQLDLGLAAQNVSEVASCLSRKGFSELKIEDMETEYCIIAHKPMIN